MSSSTGAKQVDTNADVNILDGLPIDVFLETLEWVGDSHEGGAEGSNGSPPKCIACNHPATDSSSDNVVGSVDHLDGTARFRVGRDHYLAFSAIRVGESVLRSAPAVLSVHDGKLRLALQVKEEGALRCLTLNTKEILEEPQLRKHQASLSLELAFPFVTLTFEKPDGTTSGQNGERDGTASDSYEVRFGAMLDAVKELLETPSNLEGLAATVAGKVEERELASCYENKLKRKRLQWVDQGEQNMDQTFERFMASATAMVMPLAFPYKSQRSGTEGVSANQLMHISFANLFLDMEAVRGAVMEQSEAWVQLVAKSRSHGEDRMLSKAEMEQRRKCKTQIGKAVRHQAD